MCARKKLAGIHSAPLKIMIARICVVAVFGIAFANIEATVVVYLREIFHPDGFYFPMTLFGNGPLWRRFLYIESGREVATIVLLLTTCWLAGRNRHQRFAYFLTVFAIWDIFYYLWLKVLIGWPATIMDWDVLFLIPVFWASPVLYPVLISIVLIAFAVIILYRDWCGRPLRTTVYQWLAFGASSLIIIMSFCIAGLHATDRDFESYFYRSLYSAGLLLAIATFVKCCLNSAQKAPETSV